MIKWQGHGGHFIGAEECLFRMATAVNDKYLVSTVGDYYPKSSENKRETLGAGKNDFFETFVFKIDGYMECGCAKVKEFLEIDGTRYRTAQEATHGHMEYIAKYAGKLK